MENQLKIDEDNCLFPICKEENCGGILRLEINDDKYDIKYKCEKNCEHKGNLYYKTFERFYLRKIHFEKCSNCSIILETNSQYKCIECQKFYCCKCYSTDEHIKNDITKLNTFFKACPIHQTKLNDYCVDCGEEICIFCFKYKNENPHKDHKIIYLLNMMPSSNEIYSLKQKIKEKSKVYANLIFSIDIWKKKLNRKIELLKEKLMNEIIVLKKLFNNYSQYYINYTHFKNFIYFNKKIKLFNNDYFNKFSKTINFEEQTRNMFQILFKTNFDKEEKVRSLTHIKISNPYFIGKVIDNIILIYANDCVFLLSNNNKDNKLYILNNTKILFNYKIDSISTFKEKNQIYACLKSEKIIKIFEYNLKEEKLKLLDEEIKLDFYPRKCIALNKNYLAAANEETIILYSKRGCIKVANNMDICDILRVDNNYFIYSKKNSILFYNYSDNSHENKIMKINPINLFDSLVLTKDNIIINCVDGIAVVSIKNKELIQYVKNYLDDSYKLICNINDNNIYVLYINYYHYLLTVKFDFFEGEFVEKEIIRVKDINDFKPNIYAGIKILNMGNDQLLILGLNLYSLGN